MGMVWLMETGFKCDSLSEEIIYSSLRFQIGLLWDALGAFVEHHIVFKPNVKPYPIQLR